jgi:hypothetical protein
VGIGKLTPTFLQEPYQLSQLKPLQRGFLRRKTNMDRYCRLIPIIQPLTRTSPLSYSSHFHSVPFAGNALCTRHFVTSPPSRATNFDTLKVVQRLEAQGFTPEQSQAVMGLLKDVIDESIMGLTRTMVTREEQEKVILNMIMLINRRRINRKSTLHS